MFLKNLTRPIIAAPMAGGPGTAQLVIDTTKAGGWGFLAGGNKKVSALADDVAALREADVAVGVNLFVPGPQSEDAEALASLRERMAPMAEQFNTALGDPQWDDDDFGEKVTWLTKHPADAVTFTFGLPASSDIAALKSAGAHLGAMVTCVDDAIEARRAGMDFLIVQGPAAGGHQSTFDIHAEPSGISLLELFSRVRQAVPLPLIAAGGIGTPQDVRAVIAAGAIAAQVGTTFLRSSSSGTNPTHAAALTSPEFTETALTRAFSGRYARSLVNDYMRHVTSAPAAYPEINRLMAPLRQGAAAAGDAHWTNLWAGDAWQRTFTTMPTGLAESDAGAITCWLASEVSEVDAPQR